MTMFSNKFCTLNNWISVKSVLYADSATKSPFQHLIQNALGKTRHFLRGFFKNRSELPSEIYRKQYRLPNEFRNNFNTAVTPKFKLISYRPGIIYKVTSRWYSNSLTGSWREELLKKFFRGGSGPMICFLGFALAEKKPSLLTPDEELEGVSFLIRDSFSLLTGKKQGLNIDKNNVFFNISLADLKIGDLITKGCNAAIYSASLHEDKKSNSCEETNSVEQINANDYLDDSKFLSNPKNDLNLQKPKETADWKPTNVKTDDFFNSQFFISHSEDNQCFPTDNFNKKDEQIYSGTFGSYNIALKVMFNYSAESNAFAIWNAMHRETLPVMCDLSLNDLWKYKKRRKKLKPHPNIVEMYSAFADQLPLLPGAFKNYPQALPTRLLSDGCGRNMTLFLVMKRYHCSLKDYLKIQKPSPEIALLLLTQLLEALVHLFQNSIAHRDLKCDNILLDLSEGMLSPKLVITDFGCCLEDLYLPYTSYDIPKGGNMLLMAPEVINVEPGPFSVIDYSRADLWAAAAIAYEIFGGSNPFERDFSLKNTSCNKNDLPPFPNDAYPAVKKLILDMLHINPKMRPNQSFAATVCQILLHAPSDLVKSQFDNEIGKKAFEWMFQFSAQTYLETYLGKTEPTSVKVELCRTFCSRIQYLEIVKALQYILEP